ncbi:hypothetical protein M441DRAFT_300056 [Trichoderma asperellum CBS 433.97]|uniref:Uncharacterized protein n=1 Tax=Trichoderma asperellum (strain ATCC 204424 / CBS 433.97 / NBRC 101777) TaxID=1042311 RepID=A0A2T3ZJ72_TRIA4|nr:hypothetical protein M441DRAFT_300056 [Trichoderma asperellum CBS 433.97]PTB44859.1 hypothetical protein M441DRAFT_300056 [Trichoderma asperellum CBS 433.97]
MARRNMGQYKKGASAKANLTYPTLLFVGLLLSTLICSLVYIFPHSLPLPRSFSSLSYYHSTFFNPLWTAIIRIRLIGLAGSFLLLSLHKTPPSSRPSG